MEPSSFNQPTQNPTAGIPNQAPPGVPFVPREVMPDPHPMPMQQTAAPGSFPGAGAHPIMAGDMMHQAQNFTAVPPTPPTAVPPQGQPMVGAASGMPPGPGVQPAVQAHTNPNSTQNSLLIAEIRDGIVIMNDGSFRSVVMVKSVNFDLMSPQEQESVEYAYQGFLNSLYFPIQIFIRSQKVDLQPYIEKLDKIRTEHDNMLLAMLMDDYINYIDQLSQQTNIMDKKFYIVIPYFPHVDVQKAFSQSKNFLTGFLNLFSNKDQHVVINEAELEKAKTELRNRVQAVLQGLLQAGVQGLPLDTQELIELYYGMYNPDTATRQQLKNFNSLTADVITKGAGAAPQPHLQRELL
jgi:hypothetical protein